MLDIVARVGRCESVVYRTTRDLERKRPPPPSGRFAKRDKRIVRLVGAGRTHVQVARMVGLSPRRVGEILAAHPDVLRLLHEDGWKPAEVMERFHLAPWTVRRIARRKPKRKR